MLIHQTIPFSGLLTSARASRLAGGETILSTAICQMSVGGIGRRSPHVRSNRRMRARVAGIKPTRESGMWLRPRISKNLDALVGRGRSPDQDGWRSRCAGPGQGTAVRVKVGSGLRRRGARLAGHARRPRTTRTSQAMRTPQRAPPPDSAAGPARMTSRSGSFPLGSWRPPLVPPKPSIHGATVRPALGTCQRHREGQWQSTIRERWRRDTDWRSSPSAAPEPRPDVGPIAGRPSVCPPPCPELSATADRRRLSENGPHARTGTAPLRAAAPAAGWQARRTDGLRPAISDRRGPQICRWQKHKPDLDAMLATCHTSSWSPARRERPAP